MAPVALWLFVLHELWAVVRFRPLAGPEAQRAHVVAFGRTLEAAELAVVSA